MKYDPSLFRVSRIEKSTKGKYRTIYAPRNDIKQQLADIGTKIERTVRSLDKDQTAQGFVRGRNCATNALAATGHRYILRMDLSDFFDTVTEAQVAKYLSPEIADQTTIDGYTRQGLPSSPSVTNLVAHHCIDIPICRWIEKRKLGIVYKRYADDLVFSFDAPISKTIVTFVSQVCSKSGFILNQKKTWLQSLAFGNAIVTGYAVTPSGDILATRAHRRRLRAATHAHTLASEGKQIPKRAFRHYRLKTRSRSYGRNDFSAMNTFERTEAIESERRGLEEWAKCKIPNPLSKPRKGEANTKLASEFSQAAKRWKIKLPKAVITAAAEHLRADITLESAIITRDPVMMLGCSTLGRNWTSCLSHPDPTLGKTAGGYRRTSLAWIGLKGTSMAYLSDMSEPVSVGGVMRPRLLARAWVHEFRDGTKAYDRIYGGKTNADNLKDELEKAGYINVSEVAKGLKVVGNIPKPLLSKRYLDNLKVTSVTLKNGNPAYVFHA